MRSRLVIGLAIALLLPLVMATGAPAQPAPMINNYFALLSGDQEVPPVETDGAGAAGLQLNDEMTELAYVLVTYDLEEVAQAHIHLGNPGENGPVVAFLFGPADPPVTQDGILASGTITDEQVQAVEANPCAEGAPFDGTLTSLITFMNEGCAYVNVHTTANPGGEIRGQIAPLTPPMTPGGTFTDDDDNLHEGDIETAAAAGIAEGFGDGTFRPELPVTREQMASFIVRAFGVPASAENAFTDDEGSIHEDDINALAAQGITLGCNVGGTEFCPTDPVTREQMASFIVRALALATATTDFFDDDQGSIHEDHINALFAAGITRGCTADQTKFCPTDPVLRGQMASFLVRSLGLRPMEPPPPS